MSRITEVEIIDFEFDAPNLERTGLGQLVTFKRGSKVRATKNAVVIKTDDGLRGEYVTNWVASPATAGEMTMLAPFLLGRSADRARGHLRRPEARDAAMSSMGHGAARHRALGSRRQEVRRAR